MTDSLKDEIAGVGESLENFGNIKTLESWLGRDR